MWALLLVLAAAQPRLGVIDTTGAGAPDLVVALAAEAKAQGRFDVQPQEAVDAAVADARGVGAACAFDDGPECWARLGVLAELDRVVVVRVSEDVVDLLLVDVPARTAARSSTAKGADAIEAGRQALRALLSGQVTAPPPPKPAAPKVRGVGFYTGAYAAAFGAVLVAGCGGGALGVSAQMADRLVQAKEQGTPLDDKYRGLDAAFLGLSICTGVAAAAGIGGGIAALVIE
jgi:hypothetical protein